jgi:hypothetical protein
MSGLETPEQVPHSFAQAAWPDAGWGREQSVRTRGWSSAALERAREFSATLDTDASGTSVAALQFGTLLELLLEAKGN